MEKDKAQLTTSHQTMLVIWVALLFSQFMFVFIIFMTKSELFRFDFDQPIFGKDSAIIIALAIVALISVGVSFVLRNKFRQKAFAEQKVALLQSGLITAMSLCEAATLLGFILAFVFNYQYFFAWFALGIVGMLLHFPKFGDVLAATYKSNLNDLR